MDGQGKGGVFKRWVRREGDGSGEGEREGGQKRAEIMSRENCVLSCMYWVKCDGKVCKKMGKCV